MDDTSSIVNELREREKRGLLITKSTEEKNELQKISYQPEKSVDTTSDEQSLIKDNDMNKIEIKNDIDSIDIVSLYRNITKLSPFGIFTLNARGIITSCNKKTASMILYKPEEIIGQHFLKLGVVKKEEALKYTRLFKSVIKGIDTEPFETILQRKDKTTFSAKIHYLLLKEEGKTFGILVVIIDITDQKKREEKLEQRTRELENSRIEYKDLINGMNESIWVIDFNGQFLECNNVASKMLGYSREELLSMGPMDIDSNLTSEDIKNLIKSIQKEKVQIFETVHQTKDGKSIPVEISSSLVNYQGETAILSVARNITQRKKTHEIIRTTSQHLERIITASPSAIITLDTNGMVTSWNPACERIFGWKTEEVIGKINPLVTPENRDDFFHTMGQKITNFEIQVLTKDRGVIEVNLSYAPLFDEDKFTGAIGIMTDITEHKKIEREIHNEKKVFESIILALPGIFYMLDDTGKWIQWNENINRISGYSGDELLELTAFDLVVKEDRKLIAERINECMTVGFTSTEALLLTKDGKEIPFLFTARSLILDDKKYIIGTGINISKRKKAEKELHKAHDLLIQMNESLEKKVTERTSRIEALIKQKDEFINQLGHDLKNPLGPIINLLPILEKNEQNTKKKEMLQVIDRNVIYIKNLVTKTIQLAQLQSPNINLQYETFNLGDDVQEILEVNNIMFKQHHITVKNLLPENIIIKADRLKIHEVFNNLLNNAVKYMGQNNGTITISSEPMENDSITIIFKDTGIGMTKDQLDQVFNEFYKADSSRHDFDSSGLGMPICKRIIEMHKGHIWAESEGLGNGSTFYFTLPLSQK